MIPLNFEAMHVEARTALRQAQGAFAGRRLGSTRPGVIPLNFELCTLSLSKRERPFDKLRTHSPVVDSAVQGQA